MQRLLLASFIIAGAAAALPPFVLYSATMTAPNYINVFSGDANGGVTYVRQVATGGSGGPVQSQGSVAVWQNYLFTINSLNSTISYLSISATDPTQLTLVGVWDTLGDYPTSVAVNSAGTEVCVTNSGVRNSLACFSITANGLSPVANGVVSLGLTLTTPPAFHTGPSEVAFTQDGKAVVVLNKYNAPGAGNVPIFLFPLTGLVPSATPAKAASQGTCNFAWAFDDDGSVVVVDTNPFGPIPAGGGAQIASFDTSGAGSVTWLRSTYFNTSQDGTGKLAVAPCWIVYSPAVDSFFAINTGSGDISELKRNNNALTVARKFSFTGQTAGKGLTDSWIVNLNGADYLYVTGTQEKKIFGAKLSTTAAPVDISTVATFPKSSVGLAAWTPPVMPSSAASLSATIAALVSLLAALVAALI